MLGPLVLSAVILAGCDESPPAADPAAPLTVCTTVGCADTVSANFLGLLAAGAVPMQIDVCLDGEGCVSAAVTLPDAGGGGCETSSLGTACCNFDPPEAAAQCWADPGSNILIWLPVPAAGAFAGAVHTVSATVRDTQGNVLLMDEATTKLAERQPNGPQCAPTCFQNGVEFSAP
jgi:hypothetical protein